jgi:hypothetical protein
MYPSAFRVDGLTSATFDELKSKLQQFPAGTVFRWCPQISNPFDAFSPGQREDMFKDLAGFLSKRSNERRAILGRQVRSRASGEVSPPNLNRTEFSPSER